MARLFMFAGVAVLILTALFVMFVFAINEWLIVLIGAGTVLAVGGGVVAGLSLMALGDVMQRLERLERRLNLEAEEPEEELPQRTCPGCGKTSDFDYPKCPHCGYVKE